MRVCLAPELDNGKKLSERRCIEDQEETGENIDIILYVTCVWMKLSAA